MTFEAWAGNDSSIELSPDSMEGQNIRALTDLMDQIWYKFNRHDWKAWYIFKPKEEGIDINLFWGAYNPMTKKPLSNIDFLREIFDDLKNHPYDKVRDYLKEQWLDFLDETILRDMPSWDENYLLTHYEEVMPFIIRHKELTYKGGEILGKLIWRTVYEKLDVRLRSKFQFKWQSDGSIIIDCARNIHQNSDKFEKYFGKKIIISSNGIELK